MMILFKTISILFFCMCLIACVTKQKTTSTPVTDTSQSTNLPSSSNHNKINSNLPTEENVLALKIKYPNVNLQTLVKGQTIYVGACTNCHENYSISKFNETDWSSIIDEMAPKAYLNEADKDALVKYVMSVKALEVK